MSDVLKAAPKQSTPRGDNKKEESKSKSESNKKDSAGKGGNGKDRGSKDDKSKKEKDSDSKAKGASASSSSSSKDKEAAKGKGTGFNTGPIAVASSSQLSSRKNSKEPSSAGKPQDWKPSVKGLTDSGKKEHEAKSGKDKFDNKLDVSRDTIDTARIYKDGKTPRVDADVSKDSKESKKGKGKKDKEDKKQDGGSKKQEKLDK